MRGTQVIVWLSKRTRLYIAIILAVLPVAVHAERLDMVDVSTSKNYTHSNICLDFGLTYLVHPHVQLDTYAGFNLYNSDPKLSTPRNSVAVGLGVTWLLNHP